MAVADISPDNIREVTVTCLNNGVTLRSTFKHEDIYKLTDLALSILKHLDKS